MTTEIKTHHCEICWSGTETILIDNTFWICLDPATCLERGADFDPIPLEEASPETYKDARVLEKQAKRFWEACVKQAENIRVAAGLDDTTFLTHLEILNEMYLKEC